MGDSRKNKENKKRNQSNETKDVTSKPKGKNHRKEQTTSNNGDFSDGQENSNSHEVDEIIGCTEWKGQLVFLVKWLNEPDAQVVPAAVANVNYPQKVIEFYEKRITWDQTD